MYPKSITELAALIAALVPIIIATVAGLRSVTVRWQEMDLIRWKRLIEVAEILNNSKSENGLWVQIAAAIELGDTRGNHRSAAISIIASASDTFAANPLMLEALDKANVRLTRCWIRRVLNF